VAVSLEDPSAQPPDEGETVLVRVDQDQLVDRQRVLQPGDPVDQLRCVRRSATHDNELHGSFIL
jgi:hypothetical protein